MKARHFVLASAVAIASICIARYSAKTPAQAGDTARPSPLAPRYLGAGSCSAAACHSANVTHEGIRSEYTTWITRDPHARAYEILFDEPSQKIQERLKRTVPAHDDARCLRCHVAPHFDNSKPPPAAPYFKTDGVSCESCHGPARDWINHHHLDAWRLTSVDEKKRLGMNDTRSLVGRAQVCATCHVGGAGRDVDHELIAAGHPRLHFEFSAFHAHMPRHWPDAKDRVKSDFELRAWLAGQLATAHASLELLAERSGDVKAWPEFAEFDCAACHHNLKEPSDRQKAGFGTRKPGALPWGHQVALTPIALERMPNAKALHEQIQKLQKLMDAGNPKGAAVTKDARQAAAMLKKLLDLSDPDLVGVMPERSAVEQWLQARGKNATIATDLLTQVHLGLAALERKPAMTPIYRFDPDAIRVRLLPRKKTSKEL